MNRKLGRKTNRVPVPIVTAAVLLVLAATIAAVGQATAAPSPLEETAGVKGTTGYDLSWWTVDGGGHTHVSSGAYTLGGTIGQLDAGGQVAGPPYSLLGGFWAGAQIPYRVYLPLISRQ
ncbi:MAG: hypothetical protein JXM73_21545 [Anaerolineae bacterium]|nr:hypothetical protein [Anaerolineae bacterium]